MSQPPSEVINLNELKVACQSCQVHPLCISIGLDSSDLEQLDYIVKHRRPVPRAAHLFRCQTPFQALYVIRSGSVKSYTVGNDGREQITAFHLPGEILALDAIASGEHPSSAKTLETTSVCELPFEHLESLSEQLPSLQHQLLKIMSNELRCDGKQLLLLGKRSAEERLASFLLSLSRRYKERGFSAREFNLSMSRSDIANYLGLAVETVSRLFSRFQNSGIVSAQRKLVTLHDIDQLQRISEGHSADLHRDAAS